MSRNVSSTARQAVNAPQTNQVFLTLVKLEHTDLASPLYFVNNTESIVSNGDTYVATAFRMSPPTEEDGTIANTQIVFDNIDRSITEAIRTIGGDPATVTISIVLADTPDTVEVGPWEFQLTDVKYTARLISGTLVYQNYIRDYASTIVYNANTFPGLYA